MTILALGDSLTEGYIDKEQYKDIYYPYTTTLSKLLKTKVDNKGVRGERTSPMLVRLRKIKKQYKDAIILAGTNDLDTRMEVSTIVNNIIKMHTYCHKNLGVNNTYCVSLPEVFIESKRRFEAKRKSINKKMRMYCQKNTDVIYIPLGETFTMSKVAHNMFSGNGWHFSKKGYKGMGEFIAAYIS